MLNESIIEGISDIASLGIDDFDDEMQQVAERLALAYLTGRCRAAECRQNGASDILTVWLHSQVKRDRDQWVHRRTGCVFRMVNRVSNYDSNLTWMSQAVKAGFLDVAKTCITGGSPLWSDTTNDIFRGLHDVAHVEYGLGFTTEEECHLALLTCGDFLEWVNQTPILDPIWAGHWDEAAVSQATNALLSEIALQAVAVWWLGGFDKTRENPYTGEVLHYSQKVIV
jgi:hypothetical protein